MGAELVVAPEAALDISEAYVWYESHRMGLGEEFLSAVDASIERIRRQPAIYARIHEKYRRALIRRFLIRHLLRVRGNGRNSLRRVSHVSGA
jgi:toxin ParE1/3/4